MQALARVAVLIVALLPASGWAGKTEQRSVQVTVNDITGKPAAGVQLWAENVQIKGHSNQATTGSDGRAVFQNLAPGTYKISAFENRTPAAAATLVRVERDRTANITLGLAKMTKSSNPGKKNKRYVYVAGETGTHIGGGRWVEAEDDSKGTGASAVDKSDPSMLTQPHSFDLRAFQGPSH